MSVGSNIRALAFKRRLKAIQSFVGAACLVALPFLGQLFLRQLSVITKQPLVATPWWFYVVCFWLAAVLLYVGTYLWKRAGHATQGAKGEAAIATLLHPLKAEGWRIQYGLRDRRVGDIDVSLISPTGKGFTIDVKSHGGQVRVRDRKLYRQYGKQSFPFEKDFLEQAKKQALVLQELKGLGSVTPMIVFSKATVAIKAPVAGVHVCNQAALVGLLQQLSR